MRPNTHGMVMAKVQIDQDLNKVLALLVAPDDAPLHDTSIADALVRSHIALARRSLDRFEDAARG